MTRLTSSEIDRARAAPGRAALVYLTDRCPVGCAHCSVDSLPRGGTPGPDPGLLDALVDGLCGLLELDVVGVTGGEPFVERRALERTAGALTAAGKRLAVFTSGVWAATPEPAGWIARVLSMTGCVYLGVDRFHRALLPDERVVNALRAVARAGSWAVVQTTSGADDEAVAGQLLETALGHGWADHAEILSRPLLPYGRGRPAATSTPATSTPAAGRPGAAFGRCSLASAPVVRYDGVVSACCNERVVTGSGPGGLRRRAGDAAGLRAVLAELRADPLLAAIAGTGVGALTMVPGHRDLAAREFERICQPCWLMVERAAGHPASPLLHGLAALAHGERE